MTPTYEYECVGCHTSRSITSSIFDDVPQPMCVFCGNKMYKVYTSPGIVFNAQGFYKTGG